MIPNILVNGSEGIGTGWSSTIPNFNPKDIIANINAFLDEKPLKEMVPWYRGFIGRMERNDKSGFDSVGLIAETDENVFHISELPVKVWTQPYKEFIEDMLTANVTQAKGKSVASKSKATDKPKVKTSSTNTKAPAFLINDYRDNSTHEKISFTIEVDPASVETIYSIGLEKAFKLKKSISLTNLTAFDVKGHVRKYETELDIIREFCVVRLKYYELRKQYMIQHYTNKLEYTANKLRFISLIIEGKLIVSRKPRAQLERELLSLKFDTAGEIEARFKINNKNQKSSSDDSESEEAVENKYTSKDYNYLLSMPIYSLTEENYLKLSKETEELSNKLNTLKNTSTKQLWQSDLRDLEQAIQIFEKHLQDLFEELDLAQQSSNVHKLSRPNKRKRNESGTASTKKKKNENVDVTNRTNDANFDNPLSNLEVDNIFSRLNNKTY